MSIARDIRRAFGCSESHVPVPQALCQSTASSFLSHTYQKYWFPVIISDAMQHLSLAIQDLITNSDTYYKNDS